MKGLFIKDLELLKSNKRFILIMILLLGVLMIGNPEFAIMYASIFMAIYVSKTISFDEARNGFLYIFSWPVSRKDYVFEKYLLSIGACLLSGLFLSVLTAFFESLPVREIILNYIAAILISIFMVCIFIPVQIWFGSERASMVFILIAVAVGAFVTGMIVLYDQLSVQIGYFISTGIPGRLDFWIAVSFVVIIAILAVSIDISLEALKRKQF